MRARCLPDSADQGKIRVFFFGVNIHLIFICFIHGIKRIAQIVPKFLKSFYYFPLHALAPIFKGTVDAAYFKSGNSSVSKRL